MLFERIKTIEKLEDKTEKISKHTFVNFYKRYIEPDSVRRRTFKILAKADSKVIVPDDFKPLFSFLLESHPGLEFL